MKRATGIVVTMFVLGSAAALTFQASQKKQPDLTPGVDRSPVNRLLLGVQGLSCGSCETRIREALRKDPGVRSVGVDLGRATVTVEYVQETTDPKRLADTVTRVGYPARYLASGPSVPPAAKVRRQPQAKCGGGCCSGGSTGDESTI